MSTESRAVDHRPPPKAVLFTKLKNILGPKELEPAMCAYEFAHYGHALQERHDGSTYSDHPKSAVWIYVSEFGGRDSRIIIVLFLHDLLEDSSLLTFERIVLNFGLPIALDVKALTKLKQDKICPEKYPPRIIKRGPRAILAKLIERLHNMRTLSCFNSRIQIRKIENTRELMRVLLPALHGFGGIWVQHAESVEKKLYEAFAEYD